MKKSLLACSLLMASSLAFAGVPKLEEPIEVKLADGSPIDVLGIGHSAPYYVDLDGDKTTDLVVGEFKDGAIRIYHNYGTTQKPVFKDFKFLEVEGKQATVPPS